MVALFGVSWCAPAHFLDLVLQWTYLGKGGGTKELWEAVLFVVVWSVWIARNETIFQLRGSSTRALVEKVKRLAVDWLFAQYPSEVPSQFFINGNFSLIKVH